MAFLKNNRHSVKLSLAASHKRHDRGAVMPFVAMLVILMLGTLGFAIDVMRSFETVNQLQFAGQTMALYGLSLATNPDGSYSNASAQSNIISAINAANAANWNSAQCGPVNGSWSEPVTIAQSDISFPTNPLNPSEFFLDLTDRRQGNDALQQFFLPLLYTSLTQVGVPISVETMSTAQTVEVLGQPATRIGAGLPPGSLSSQANANLAGFACFPLAISNIEFSTIANPSQIPTSYTIDLVSSTYGGVKSPTHIQGCLVNVGTYGSSTSYYGNAQGNLAIGQLEGLLGYFTSPQSFSAIAPAFVERGSQLNAFDPADPAFIANQSAITGFLSDPSLVNRFFIFPVLASDPSFASINTVAGFAWLQLSKVNVTGGSGTPISITVTMGQSIPLRNACSVSGLSTVPTSFATPMPAAVYPFTGRTWDSTSNGVSISPRGVVLAPALSPRPISSLFHPS
jgi:Flp pilus assembly protein TadG